MDSGGSGERQPAVPIAEERRQHRRVDSKLRALVSDSDTASLPREGTLVERSIAGFRIETRHPEAVGTNIEIEVRTATVRDGGLTFYRGRVIHVAELGGGTFAMGVHLSLDLGQRISASSRIAGRRRARSEARSEVEAVPKHATLPEPESASSDAPAVTFRRVKPKRSVWKYRGWAIALAVVALLIALFMLNAIQLNAILDRPGGSATLTSDGQRESIPEMAESSEPGLLSGADDTEVLSRVAGSTAGIFVMEPGVLLSRADAALSRGDGEAAAELYAQLESHPGANGTQRYISLLGHARAADARGERGLALELVRRANMMAATVSPVWAEEAVALQRALTGRDAAPTPTPFEPMDTLVGFEEVADTEGQIAPLRIEVSTTGYTLSVIRGDEVLGSFPVGLGRNGTTPHGTFRILNKISEPDWYDRGRTVRSGDPENPLGSRWLGLGTDTAPTSYGIHATSDPRSIGQPFSRGCVRMRPSDVESLFRLVPLGTPVSIVR
ncbi:MAG: L,D-transpeptidase family protein [Candidatus Hydrogenedentes bacterium]|nr:L,D-transpeptidase family protein [Candidatus Hydrogenedentota bacterium]